MKRVLTIERTAKRFKAMGLLSKVMVFTGMIIPMFNLDPMQFFLPLALFTFIAGLALALYVRVAVWWCHG